LCKYRIGEAPSTVTGPEMKTVTRNELMGIKQVVQLNNTDAVNKLH
jgi:hypothetical protein